MRSWRWLLPAVAITALSAVSACDTPGRPGAPVSQPSEVTGRVWFCTPSQVHGQPGEDKASDSAVTLEIVTAASSGASDSKRFPPNTVLGRATANGDERWPPGSVHELFVAWLHPGVDRSDLENQSLRVRVVRRLGWTGPSPGLDVWAFSFFLSFDVVTYPDTGDPSIGWHLGVVSTDYIVAEHDQEVILDTPFSELRGWPHPCPKP